MQFFSYLILSSSFPFRFYFFTYGGALFVFLIYYGSGSFIFYTSGSFIFYISGSFMFYFTSILSSFFSSVLFFITVNYSTTPSFHIPSSTVPSALVNIPLPFYFPSFQYPFHSSPFLNFITPYPSI